MQTIIKHSITNPKPTNQIIKPNSLVNVGTKNK